MRTDRIESLRRVALERSICNDEFHYWFYKRYGERRFDSEYSRYADAFSHAFSMLTPNMRAGELIVGEIENNLTEEARAEWFEIYKPMHRARCAEAGGGQQAQ